MCVLLQPVEEKLCHRNWKKDVGSTRVLLFLNRRAQQLIYDMALFNGSGVFSMVAAVFLNILKSKVANRYVTDLKCFEHFVILAVSMVTAAFKVGSHVTWRYFNGIGGLF